MSLQFLSNPMDFNMGFDLKTTFYDFLYGSNLQPPHGRWVVWQKVRKDSEGKPIIAEQAYKYTEEGSGYNAPGITRTGYLCDEELIRAYMSPAGRRLIMDEVPSPMGNFQNERMLFYTSHLHSLKQHDIICTLKVDEFGKPVNPVTVETQYIVTLPVPRTLYNGREEYFTTITEQQK